jgi:hypothetical protein
MLLIMIGDVGMMAAPMACSAGARIVASGEALLRVKGVPPRVGERKTTVRSLW